MKKLCYGMCSCQSAEEKAFGAMKFFWGQFLNCQAHSTGSIKNTVLTLWQRVRVGTIKIPLNLPSWQSGYVAATPKKPPNNPCCNNPKQPP